MTIFLLSPDQSLCVTVEDVINHLHKLERKACGSDGMLYWILQDCRASFEPALTVFYNLCLSEGYVPRCLKMANVTRVPKCNNPAVTNFRPIALLLLLSKIFEKIVSSKWLRVFLCSRKNR